MFKTKAAISLKSLKRNFETTLISNSKSEGWVFGTIEREVGQDKAVEKGIEIYYA